VGQDLLFFSRGAFTWEIDSMFIGKILLVKLGFQLDDENVTTTSRREGGVAYCHAAFEITGSVGAA
jgi:hypothetical protein